MVVRFSSSGRSARERRSARRGDERPPGEIRGTLGSRKGRADLLHLGTGTRDRSARGRRGVVDRRSTRETQRRPLTVRSSDALLSVCARDDHDATLARKEPGTRPSSSSRGALGKRMWRERDGLPPALVIRPRGSGLASAQRSVAATAWASRARISFLKTTLPRRSRELVLLVL